MSDIVLLIDDSDYDGIHTCRICHEQEFQSLESPCACSGTLKFAHRDCIQRWCNEKGNTICEICLQKYEPGYTSPPKKTQLIDTTVTVRVSLEEPRIFGAEQENEEEILETDGYSECVSAADTSAACCRSVALIITALLLFRHVFGVINGGAEEYPFSMLTVLTVRIIGIVCPMYILLRIIAALHDNIRHQYQIGQRANDHMLSESPAITES